MFLTMNRIILNVLKRATIMQNTCVLVGQKTEKKIMPIYYERLKNQNNGIFLMKGGNGTENKERNHGLEEKIRHFVRVSVLIIVVKNFITKLKNITKKEFAFFVEKSLALGRLNLQEHAHTLVRQKCDGTPVYSLTLEKDNVYFANGILVSNCSDTLFMRMYFVLKEKLSPYQSEERARANEMLEMQIARTAQRQPMNSSE